jgi:elongator complex protein 2
LWPEHEKLYGHGYEISAVAVSRDRTLIATACKASSIDHAVVRLYDASDWHEIRPSLAAHTLTITSLSFSADDQYLLSVGRDRQWAVYRRSQEEPSVFKLMTSNPKGHSRMILDADWAPASDSQQKSQIFATAGRDKSIKLWQLTGDSIECKATIPARSSVTAVKFLPRTYNGALFLATGEDDGKLSIHQIKVDGVEPSPLVSFDRDQSPSKTITELSWRPILPVNAEAEGAGLAFELAVASEDTSIRIYSIAGVVSEP